MGHLAPSHRLPLILSNFSLPVWRDVSAFADGPLSDHARSWLHETGSLTTRLRLFWPDLAVKVLAEGCAGVWKSERAFLAAPAGTPLWLREVVLHSAQRPLVYARTVIPAPSGPGSPWEAVCRLGSRPLGELLFESPGLARSDFEWALCQRLDGGPALGPVMARRCRFGASSAPLCLSEFFLDPVFA